MADKKSTDKGVQKASKPKKLLKGGVDPSVGKATQIKPGQVLNPNGRPKGKHINTWIQELAEDEEFTTMLTDARDGWKEFKGAPIKAIVKTALQEAMNGRDAKERQVARDWIARYGWPTKNEVSGADGAPLMPIALDSSILNRLAQNGDTPTSGTTTDRPQ